MTPSEEAVWLARLWLEAGTKAYRGPVFEIDVLNCARCGEDHTMKFFTFKKSVVHCDGKVYTHWGLCPTVGDPVLMYIEAHED